MPGFGDLVPHIESGCPLRIDVTERVVEAMRIATAFEDMDGLLRLNRISLRWLFAYLAQAYRAVASTIRHEHPNIAAIYDSMFRTLIAELIFQDHYRDYIRPSDKRYFTGLLAEVKELHDTMLDVYREELVAAEVLPPTYPA